MVLKIYYLGKTCDHVPRDVLWKMLEKKGVPFAYSHTIHV